jgi:RNA 2',3'-cyclic 3'-phosphodiesterase
MPHADTARLFIAIDPPAEVRAQLAGWARVALGLRRADGTGANRPLRVLDSELLHLTLCFLGARPVEEIELVGTALAQCAVSVGELSIGAPLWLPPRRPRVLAVEVHDPLGDLARLHDSLTLAIAAATSWTPAASGETRGSARRRRLRPHVTLARMREGAAPRARELPPTPALAFTPGELILYRSWLTPEGASYEALARATLIPA